MFWITCLKLFFWVAIVDWHKRALANIEEEMDVHEDSSCYYNDRDAALKKLDEANAQVAKLVNGQELKFLGVLGAKRCEELLQKKLADVEKKIISAPTVAAKWTMSTEVYTGYYLGLEAKRNNIRRDLEKLEKV